eukprot:scaffold1390_cov138-Cylindrotheca_fusiformis.AAC.49
MPGSCDACGWLAAFGGMLAFGSFGVPIKSDVARSVDIATVYAIKNAGLAIGIGVGSSFIVLISFTWGIFVFDEHVHSRLDACFAVGCMMVGLLGMAYYSAPSISHPSPQPLRRDSEESPYLPLENDEPEDGAFDDEAPNEDAIECSESDDEVVVVDDSTIEEMLPDTHTICCGMKVQRRTLGILAAMFTGIYGGSILAPMKFAPADAKGSHFLLSFAIGASIVNLSIWVVRCFFLLHRHGSMSRAYAALPSFHFRKMWLYGGACGTLWSIGNAFSILSVEFLGEGVGYSVVQSSMLVSGLWGIFYFKEIEGVEIIAKWLASASITVLGILLLSFEHHEK